MEERQTQKEMARCSRTSDEGDASNEDARGMIRERMQRKHFMYRGGVNGDVSLT